MDVARQILVIYTGSKGFLNDVQPARIKDFESGLLAHAEKEAPGLLEEIKKAPKITAKIEEKLTKLITGFKSSFK